MNKKIQALKLLIKEAVREVVREEMRVLLKEIKKSPKPVLEQYEHEQVGVNRKNPYEAFLPKPPVQNRTVVTPKSSITKASTNPIERLLEQTKQSMNGSDFSNHMSMGEAQPGFTPPAPVQLDPAMMESIGEIEEWSPSSVNLPDFPAR